MTSEVTTASIQAASYGGTPVQWVNVDNAELRDSNWTHRHVAQQDSTTGYWYNARLFIRFCAAQSMLNIQGPLIPCMFFCYKRECEIGDDVNEWKYSIDAELVEQAIAKRLGSQTPLESAVKYRVADTHTNFLSEVFINTVFTPVIPNTPLVSAAMSLSEWRWSLGLMIVAIPLLTAELLLRTIANVGLSLAIVIQRWFDPAEAELLKVRSLMNSKDPTRAMVAYLYRSV